MQRNYLQIKQFLEQEYPELRGNISGGNYPPPPYVPFLQSLVTLLHVFTLATVFIGERIWTLIPFVRTAPSWYHDLKAYPMQTFVLIFLIIPSIVTSSGTTGAFEIILDDEVVWSRLETGRFPDGPMLLSIFRRALKR